jgi:hypothetical protein
MSSALIASALLAIISPTQGQMRLPKGGLQNAFLEKNFRTIRIGTLDRTALRKIVATQNAGSEVDPVLTLSATRTTIPGVASLDVSGDMSLRSRSDQFWMTVKGDNISMVRLYAENLKKGKKYLMVVNGFRDYSTKGLKASFYVDNKPLQVNDVLQDENHLSFIYTAKGKGDLISVFFQDTSLGENYIGTVIVSTVELHEIK